MRKNGKLCKWEGANNLLNSVPEDNKKLACVLHTKMYVKCGPFCC